LEQARRDNRVRGGANRSNKARAQKELAMTPADLLLGLSRAFRQVQAGAMPHGTAHALAVLAKTISGIQEAQASREIERRLRELEEATGLERRTSA
jgi:hypothetical protein